MGISREQSFSLAVIGLGVVLAWFGQGSLIALVIGGGLVIVGGGGFMWPRPKSSYLKDTVLLVMLMREGRAIRDSMGVGKVNPGNSRVNESRCGEWERAVYEAMQSLDAPMAESFMLGNPEVTTTGYDRVNWQQFMDVRLNRLDKIISELRP